MKIPVFVLLLLVAGLVPLADATRAYGVQYRRPVVACPVKTHYAVQTVTETQTEEVTKTVFKRRPSLVTKTQVILSTVEKTVSQVFTTTKMVTVKKGCHPSHYSGGQTAVWTW